MNGVLMPKITAINHVAVVVDDIEQSLVFWRDALGIELHELREVPAEKSQVAFYPLLALNWNWLCRRRTIDAKYSPNAPACITSALVDDIIGMMSQLKTKYSPYQRRSAHRGGRKKMLIHRVSGRVLVSYIKLPQT